MDFKELEKGFEIICFKILINDLFQNCIHLKNHIKNIFFIIMKRVRIAFVLYTVQKSFKKSSKITHKSLKNILFKDSFLLSLNNIFIK